MRTRLVWLSLLLFGEAGVRLAAARPAPASFCAEWVRQSREGYERVTLFRDGMVVWKTNRRGTEELRRKPLAPDELAFYCRYFSRAEVWSLPSDLRSRLTGDFTAESAVTLTRADGARKEVRFDELSALTAEAAALRAALEGLRESIVNPLAPASRFGAEALVPGTLLRRFDGALFRVRTLEREKGVVEIEGVSEPYSQFFKVEELRFQFHPPE